MSAQQSLPLPSPAPSNCVVINARCSLRTEADQRVIVVAGLPVHHYRAEDGAAEAYAMVFLVDSGFAKQTEVARAFGRSVRTVRRNQERYAKGGMAALGHETGWRRGRRRISAKRLRTIERLKSQGMSNRAIAHRLGVTEKAIRQLVGPTRAAKNAQLALPLLLATVVYAVMYIWHRGISEIFKRVAENPVPIETFMAMLTKDRILRPPGTAVFLTRSLKDTPPVIAWYVEHSRALQERVVAITVESTSTPRVTERDRFSIVEVAPGFWRAVAHYGFMERPNVSRLLREFSTKGCAIDLSEITYYVGLETIVAREDTGGLPRWLVVLFAAIYRNAAHVTDDYKFPRDRVLEIGRQVAI